MARVNLSIGADSSYGGNTDPMGDRGPNPYHPTVAFLLALVLVEFAAVLLLRFAFRTSHGG